MKTTMITEFVKFQAAESTTEEQLLSQVEILNAFQKKQDGFIDAELVKDVKENAWCIVYHYENMEKVKVIGENLRSSKLFDAFMPLIVPGSLGVSFYNHLGKW